MSMFSEVLGSLDEIVKVVDVMGELAKMEDEEEKATGKKELVKAAVKEEKKQDNRSVGQMLDDLFDDIEKFADSPELGNLLDKYAQKHKLGEYAEDKFDVVTDAETDEFIEQQVELTESMLADDKRNHMDHCLQMTVQEAKKVLKKGDHIFCRRGCYELPEVKVTESGISVNSKRCTEECSYKHHGIYDGEGGVMHFANEEGDGGWVLTDDVMVTVNCLETFAGQDKIYVRSYGTDLSGDEIVKRARSMAGKEKYNDEINNCLHFAYWCRGALKSPKK